MRAQPSLLFEQFKRLAVEADAKVRAVSGRTLLDAAAGAANDRYLAQFQVYGYLMARSSLRSRAALLEELYWLKRTPLKTPPEVVDADRFGLFRLALIDELIASLGGAKPW